MSLARERAGGLRVLAAMSKQALIDRAWQVRLLSYQPETPAPARIPALRPALSFEGSARVPEVNLSSSAFVQVALAALAGFCAAGALRRIGVRPVCFEDDIDWESAAA